jgi:hypothetical protein
MNPRSAAEAAKKNMIKENEEIKVISKIGKFSKTGL